MPLDVFADEVIALFARMPSSREIVIDAAVPFCFAERDGQFDQLLAAMTPA